MRGGYSIEVLSCSPARCARAGVLFVLCASLFGCLYDPDDRCSENQVLSDESCVCAPGAAPTKDGCVMCGDNEVPGANGCMCAEGFMRESPEGGCEEVKSELGLACDESAECDDERYDHCRTVDGASGYCTSTGCTSSDDCESGYACETSASPSYCRRPPVGVGRSCSSAADCADTEATYCDTFVSNTCVVEGCTVSPNSCFEGNECCDLSMFGLPALCTPIGECPL